MNLHMNEGIDLGLGGLGEGLAITGTPEAVAPIATEKKAVIMIDQVENQPNYEFVGVNGVGFQIRRGEEVTVPLSVVEVLNNAIATRSVTDKEGKVISEQDYHAIPFRVLRYL